MEWPELLRGESCPGHTLKRSGMRAVPQHQGLASKMGWSTLAMNSSTCWGAMPRVLRHPDPPRSPLVRGQAGWRQRGPPCRWAGLFLDPFAGGNGVLDAGALVQLLTVAPFTAAIMMFSHSEGQLSHQVTAQAPGYTTMPSVTLSMMFRMASVLRKPSAMPTRALAVVQRVRSNLHWVPVVKPGFSTSTIR